MKVLILVLSVDDHSIYSEFNKAQLETWDSIDVDGIETYYYYGGNDKNDIIDNKILLSLDETLYNCGSKTLMCFDMIKEMEFDYIFRTNSSSYVDKKLLKEYLVDKPKTNYYSGIIGNYEGIKFSSGSGYFLSRDLFNLVLENKKKWNHEYIDDVALGLLLHGLNIPPTLTLRYDVTSDNIPLKYFHYRLKLDGIDRNVDINNMYEIHRLKNETNK